MLKPITLTLAILSIAFLACSSSGDGGDQDPNSVQDPTPDTLQGPETTGDVSKQTDGEPRVVRLRTFTLANGEFPTYLSHMIGQGRFHLFPLVTLSNPATSKRTVVVRASLSGYSKEAETTIELEPGKETSGYFDAPIDFPALNAISTPVAAKFALSLTTQDGKVLFSVSVPTRILPKNTVVWKKALSEDGKAERIAAAGLLTTPHDAWGEIDKLLHEAALRSKFKSMYGYDNYANPKNTRQQDLEGAMDQVGAIYNALKARKFNYTNVQTDYFDGSAQNVRYPAESLRATTGNCIDGTAVFASALEAIEMRPFYSFVPRHVFLGVFTTKKGFPNDDQILLVETTMLGTHDFVAAAEKAKLELDEARAAGTLIPVFLDEVRAKKWLPSPFPTP